MGIELNRHYPSKSTSLRTTNCSLGRWVLIWFTCTIVVFFGSDDSVEEKSEYKLLRDARVAELAQKFRAVQEAADNL
jgi:hypothetical protein